MLNSEEIKNFLLKKGFKGNVVNARILGFVAEAGHYPVYVKTPSGNTTVEFVEKEPLVIHPRYLAYKNAISRIPGVIPNWEAYFHNSNMKGFDKRVNNGKKPINYGVALSVKDEHALQELLDGLRVDFAGAEQTFSDELESAAADISVVPETTRKAIVDARVGQGQFRFELINLWRQCAVTGCTIIQLLKASHIKPWRSSSNQERLDKFNGLLLSPLLDAAFDAGLISFEDGGSIIIMSAMSIELERLGIHQEMQLKQVFPQHAPYLAWHRKHVYQG